MFLRLMAHQGSTPSMRSASQLVSVSARASVAPLAQVAASAAQPIQLPSSAALPAFASKPVSILAATEAAALPRRSARPLVFNKTKYVSPLAVYRQATHPIPTMSASMFARAMSTEKPQVFDQQLIIQMLDCIKLEIFIMDMLYKKSEGKKGIEAQGMTDEQLELALSMLPGIQRLAHQLMHINDTSSHFDNELRGKLQVVADCVGIDEINKISKQFPKNTSNDYKLLVLYIETYLSIFIPYRELIQFRTGERVFTRDADAMFQSVSFYLNDPMNESSALLQKLKQYRKSSSPFSTTRSNHLLRYLSVGLIGLLVTGYIIHTLRERDKKNKLEQAEWKELEERYAMFSERLGYELNDKYINHNVNPRSVKASLENIINELFDDLEEFNKLKHADELSVEDIKAGVQRLPLVIRLLSELREAEQDKISFSPILSLKLNDYFDETNGAEAGVLQVVKANATKDYINIIHFLSAYQNCLADYSILLGKILGEDGYDLVSQYEKSKSITFIVSGQRDNLSLLIENDVRSSPRMGSGYR